MRLYNQVSIIILQHYKAYAIHQHNLNIDLFTIFDTRTPTFALRYIIISLYTLLSVIAVHIHSNTLLQTVNTRTSSKSCRRHLWQNLIVNHSFLLLLHMYMYVNSMICVVGNNRILAIIVIVWWWTHGHKSEALLIIMPTIDVSLPSLLPPSWIQSC